MKLNPDCIRDILITVEEHSIYKCGITYPSAETESLTQTYSDMQIRYHIDQAAKANLLELTKTDSQYRMYIQDLTPAGHEFLANVRSDTVWNKTKAIGREIGITSLNAFSQISSNVITAIIKSHFGLL